MSTLFCSDLRYVDLVRQAVVGFGCGVLCPDGSGHGGTRDPSGMTMVLVRWFGWIRVLTARIVPGQMVRRELSDVAGGVVEGADKVK
jgi:hypothetical protein